jgi:glycosyltransferase involved in cell wall biosynthesis
MTAPKIALVHDYLREYGGAERVVESMHEIYPEAPVYVAVNDPQRLGKQAKRFESWDIRETWLKRLPFAKSLVSPYRVFAARAFESLDLSEFDVIISSTNMYMAKAVRAGKDAVHVSYVHTPPRSLYGYTTMTNWRKNPLVRAIGEGINSWMRYVDFQTAQRPDVLIANSRTTQQRIAKFYRRESVVLPPAVRLVDKQLDVLPKSERTFALFVGRLAYSKHPELALHACQTLGIPLKVVGTGGMMDRVRQLAGPETELIGSASDKVLSELYQRAKFVIYPAEDEDFGIVPIEAMSAGTPVIAHASGEPQFTVKDGVTGTLVPSFKPADWLEAVREANTKNWQYESIQKSVQKYSSQDFADGLTKIVAQARRQSK